MHGEIDNCLCTFHTAKLVDILYYLIYGNEDEPVPKSYKCARNSPVDPNSGWTTTRPKVSFGHIFCGQICSGKAEGFHSLTTSSNYGVCAKVNPPGCNWFNDGNGKCAPGIVEIWDDTTKKWVPKLDVSSMFSSTKTLATIINILVKIYNECQPPAGSTTLCALGCRYQGNFNSFDIKLVLRPQGILSAFPLPAGECTDTPRCSPNCQNI